MTRRHLPPALVSSAEGSRRQVRVNGSGSLHERLEQMEKEIIREALERHGGVVAGTGCSPGSREGAGGPGAYCTPSS